MISQYDKDMCCPYIAEGMTYIWQQRGNQELSRILESLADRKLIQTVRELAGTAYMAGRSAPPTAVEVEAVAKRLLWRSCKKWDGVESDYVAKDEDDAWDYAGEIPGFQEEYIRQAKEMLEIARKAVSE